MGGLSGAKYLSRARCSPSARSRGWCPCGCTSSRTVCELWRAPPSTPCRMCPCRSSYESKSLEAMQAPCLHEHTLPLLHQPSTVWPRMTQHQKTLSRFYPSVGQRSAAGHELPVARLGQPGRRSYLRTHHCLKEWQSIERLQHLLAQQRDLHPLFGNSELGTSTSFCSYPSPSSWNLANLSRWH